VSGAGLCGIGDNSAEASYHTWVDQHNRLGLGLDVPISTGNENDALLALVEGKWAVLRFPNPLSFYTEGLDGRIDDTNAEWKGRGVWTTNDDRRRGRGRRREHGADRLPFPAAAQPPRRLTARVPDSLRRTGSDATAP
jgi:hypothetical protein